MSGLIVPDTPRRCGYLKDGGVYLMGLVSPDGTYPTAVPIEPAVPAQHKHFRGWRWVYGHAIRLRLPEEAWWCDSSSLTEHSKLMQRMDLLVFGMPWKWRKGAGFLKRWPSRDRMEATTSYRYRLAEQSPCTEPEPAHQASWFAMHKGLPEGRTAATHIAARRFGDALAAIWRGWLTAAPQVGEHEPQVYTTEADTLRTSWTAFVLDALTGDTAESTLLGALHVQRCVDPAPFLALVPRPEDPTVASVDALPPEAPANRGELLTRLAERVNRIVVKKELQAVDALHE